MNKNRQDKPRVLDLFAGAGGLSAGFSSAGFEIVGAIEKIAIYCKTHEVNFPQSKTVCADMAEMLPGKFESITNIREGDIDVVIGGPPCQSFSTIGTPKINFISKNDGLTDPRNYLFKPYLDFVKYYKPSIFVMENVPALQTKYKGALFTHLLEEVDKLGYTPHVAVLNASDYGVPQIRRRLIIIGTRNNLQFKFPKPSHGLNIIERQQNLYEEEVALLRPINLVSDALTDLPQIYDGCREDQLPYKNKLNLTEYQLTMRESVGMVRNNICRMSNERAKKVFSYMKQGDRYMDLPKEVRQILPFREDIFHDRLKRLRLDSPSWTVLAHIGMDGYMYIHPTEDRTLSVREAARLQSFHDSFIFVGNMREQYIQVGNAVPPLLAQAIANSIKTSLI